ncbi:hypothetical protein GWI33_016607 [Rhynchophorus ferrugineus]|uniref:Uncharacterized protein n=1 Tax=Rhynchophorus ferrugineus TaxID=354439 RepID=A0A834I0T9_RHYFE|nr:hypothetical protein GWI33_016607 [Rhynchophorus ferrugineus]
MNRSSRQPQRIAPIQSNTRDGGLGARGTERYWMRAGSHYTPTPIVIVLVRETRYDPDVQQGYSGVQGDEYISVEIVAKRFSTPRRLRIWKEPQFVIVKVILAYFLLIFV